MAHTSGRHLTLAPLLVMASLALQSAPAFAKGHRKASFVDAVRVEQIVGPIIKIKRKRRPMAAKGRARSRVGRAGTWRNGYSAPRRSSRDLSFTKKETRLPPICYYTMRADHRR